MNRIAKTTLLSLTLLALPAAAQEPPKEPPPAIKAMIGRMAGTWTAKDVSVTAGGKAMKAQGRVTCIRTPGGGLSCHVQATMPGMKEEETNVQATMPGMKEEETNVLGWDPESGKVHLFAVNAKYSHDHVGTLDGEVLSLAYSGTRNGKAWEEALSFTFKGDRELVWKDTCTSGGQVVFAGEGTYRK